MNFGNLGIALGAFTDEQKAQAEEARKQQQFQWQKDAEDRRAKVQQARDEAQAWAKTIQQQAAGGDLYGAANTLSQYHNATGYLGNTQSEIVKGADGNHYVIGYENGQRDGTNAQVTQLTPEVVQQHLQGALAHRMMLADPDNYMQNYGHLRQLQQGDEKNRLTDKGLRLTDAYHTGALSNQKDHNRITEERYKALEELQRRGLAIQAGNLARQNRLADMQITGLQEKLDQDRELRGIGKGLAALENSKVGATPEQIKGIEAAMRSYRQMAEGIQGKFLDPNAPLKGGAGTMPQMSVTDYAKLDELATERARVFAKDPRFKNQSPDLLKSMAREQILGEMGYGVAVKGVTGTGGAGGSQPGYADPYAGTTADSKPAASSKPRGGLSVGASGPAGAQPNIYSGVNFRPAAMPVAGAGKLYDYTFGGKANYESLGKPYSGAEDAVLEWMLRNQAGG